MTPIFVLVVAAFTGAGGTSYARTFTSAADCSAAEDFARVAVANALPGAAYEVKPCFVMKPEKDRK